MRLTWTWEKCLALLIMFVMFFSCCFGFWHSVAKANTNNNIVELRVTSHSFYVIDKKYGLCFYEQEGGSFVIQIEGNICEDLLRAN